MATIDELRKLLEELDERQLGELGLQKASDSMKDLTNATDEQIKSFIRLNNAEIELALMRGDRLEAENALAELNEKINALQERRIQITTGMSEEERKLAVAQEKEIEGLIKLKDNYKAMGLEARNLTKDQENLKKESDAFFDSLTKGTGIALNASEGIAGSLFKFASAFRSSGDNMNVFLKSMGTYVNMTTIANGLTTKIVESTIAMGRAFDEATAAFAGATGAGDKFNDTLLGVRMEANTAGVNFENASQALQGLMESFVGISSISETAQKELVKTTAQLIRIGVSAQETTSLLNTFTLNMGMSANQAMDFTKELIQMGSAADISSSRLISDFNEAQSVIAVYGESSIEVFKDLSAAAKAAGVQMSSMLAIAGQFDTFESAAVAVGKLNAILGTQMSSTEMLMMTEERRTETLIQQVQASGLNFADMDRFKQKAIAAAVGISDMNEAQRIFGMNMAQYDEYQRKMDSVANVQKNFENAVAATVPLQEKFSILIAEFAIFAEPMLDALTGIVEGLTFFIKEVGMAGKIATLVGGIVTMAASAFGLFKVSALGASTAAGALGATSGGIAAAGGAIGTAASGIGAGLAAATPGILGFGAAMLLAGSGIAVAAVGIGYMVEKFGELGAQADSLASFTMAVAGFTASLAGLAALTMGPLGLVTALGVGAFFGSLTAGLLALNAALEDNVTLQANLENLALIATGTSANAMSTGAVAAVQAIRESISATYERRLEIVLTVNDGRLSDFIEAELQNIDPGVAQVVVARGSS
jgi:hypothetical protein